MKTNEGISVVIPTLGQSSTLPKLLESIRLQKTDFSIETIVVYNDSNEDLYSDFLKNFIAVKLLRSEKGVNRARNHGLRAAQYDTIMFFDDDCVLIDSLILKTHFEYHRKRPDVFTVGGRYSLPLKAKFWDKVYSQIQLNWLNNGVYNVLTHETDYLIGGHFSVKKSLCLKHNIFLNEDIVYGGSELSFFLKARSKGLSNLLLNMDVEHHTSESYYSIVKKIFKQGKNHLIANVTSKKSLNNYTVLQHIQPFSFESYCIDLTVKYFSYVYTYSVFKAKKNLLGFFKYLLKNIYNYIRNKKYSLQEYILEEKSKS